jgi:hypothetical protein
LEDEDIACSDAVRETKGLVQLVKEVTAESSAAESSTNRDLYLDNQRALKTIVSGVSKASTKHITNRESY